MLQGTDAYIMGDFNVDLLKLGTRGPTADYFGEFTSRGFYPLVSLPTRLTDTTATLIDNIWTNKIGVKMESGLVTVSRGREDQRKFLTAWKVSKICSKKYIKNYLFYRTTYSIMNSAQTLWWINAFVAMFGHFSHIL